MATVLIRDERAADVEAVRDVVVRAFGQPVEMRLVEQLRRDGDVTISLVAISDGTVIGHILLSPIAAPFRALGLAPLSVVPERQRQGVGAALVDAAIRQARDGGWAAIFVLGDPNYYGRFGFRADLAAALSSPYAGPHFMLLPLVDALPARSGTVAYAPAFVALD